jgi:RNA polymerase sigma-70 factor (ECF subfamily)
LAPETPADRLLLERARAGDAEALDRLFAPQVKALRRWMSGRLPKWAGGMTDTDDLIQDTLLQTFKRLRCFEPRGAGALQAYVRQAALNHLRDELRRRNRQPHSTDIDGVELSGGATPLEDAIGSEAIETYERALHRLSPQERQTIIGRIELGYTYEELAQALGKPSVAAARKAAQRAVLHLAHEMGNASNARALPRPAP